MKDKLTIAQAKAQLPVGFTLAKREGEYRVATKREVRPPMDYFTDDIHDAVATAKEMSKVVAKAQAAAAAVVVPRKKAFVVASVSTKANAFGLHGIVLVALDGEAWEVGHCQCSPGPAWVKGQIIDFTMEADIVHPIPRFVGCEIPRRLAPCPASEVDRLFAHAFHA